MLLARVASQRAVRFWRAGQLSVLSSCVRRAAHTVNINVDLGSLGQRHQPTIRITGTDEAGKDLLNGDQTINLNKLRDVSESHESSLLSLGNLELCRLFESLQLQDLAHFARDFKLTGTNLAYGVESVEDLTLMGLNIIQARTLLRLVRNWTATGVPLNYNHSSAAAPGSISIPQLEELLMQQAASDSAQADSPENFEQTPQKIEPDIKQHHTATIDEPYLPNETGFDAHNTSSTVHKVPEVEFHASLDSAYVNCRWGNNKEEALAVLQHAARTEPLAQAYLSTLYEKGCYGLKPHHPTAVEYAKLTLPWLYEQASNGNPYAQFNLALCYHDGRGVRQDFTKAAQLYELASLQGHHGAGINLAVCHEHGAGVEEDRALACEYYKFYADLGHPHAMYCLGYCYQRGAGVPQSDIEAVKYFTQAAALGHGVAQYQLGLCLLHGQGVQLNMSAAREYLNKAAEQGIDGALAYCVWLSGELPNK